MIPCKHEVVVGDRHVRRELESRLAQLCAGEPKRGTPSSPAARLQKVWGWIRSSDTAGNLAG